MVSPLKYKDSPFQEKNSIIAAPKHDAPIDIEDIVPDRSILTERFNRVFSNGETVKPEVKPIIPNLPTPAPMPGDCDVKKYILDNAKFYYGDESFLSPPTARTQKALNKFKELLAKERENGGVLSVDAETPSTITSHEPGYLLSKEEDIIVGLQADAPLKRTCKPKGGFGIVKKALEAYGYEPGERLKVFATDVTTHNDLTFSMYTAKVRHISTFSFNGKMKE